MKRLNEAKWGTNGAGVGQSLKLSLACVAVALMLAACGGGGGGDPEADTSGPKVAGTVAGLTASGLVLSNGTDTVTVPANAANFDLPAGGTLAVAHQPLGFSQACEVGGTASSPSVSCGAAAAKVSWAAGWGERIQLQTAGMMGPDGRLYFLSSTAVFSALPSGEGGYRVLAGSTMENGGADGVGDAARFNSALDMVMDADGNFYVLDQDSTQAYSIRKVTPTGVVSTIASGLGGGGLYLGYINLGPSGQIYLVSFSSGGQAVQRINAQGQLEEVFKPTVSMAGMTKTPSIDNLAVGGDGAVYWSDNSNAGIYKWSPGASSPILLAGSGTGAICGNTGCPDGAPQTARIHGVSALKVDSQGVLYALDYYNTLLRRISATGVITTIVGNPTVRATSGNADGSGASATIDASRMSLSADGSTLYLGQYDPMNVRVVRNLSASAADVSTVLTLASVQANPANQVKQALLSSMSVVAADASGNIYVNESALTDGSTLIRKITPQGGVSTAGASVLRNDSVRGLKVGTDGSIYLVGPCSIERMAANGTTSTLVGDPSLQRCSTSVDGPAGTATASDIFGFAPDGGGNVIFGDGSQTLRKLASDGSITTLTLVDDTGASFPFQWATALVANAQGQLYFTDGWRVFKVVVQGTQGTVSLVAGGNPNLSGSIDGDALTQASFSSIYDMTLDAAGNLYVMDDLLLRQITPQGQVRTLAGKAGTNALLDGVGTGASFNDIPYGDSLTATPGGEVYVLDSGFLRKVEAVKAPSTPAKN